MDRGRVKWDSFFSLLSLPAVHGNEQVGLKCEMWLSLSSAASGSRTFLYLQFNVYTECLDHTCI